MTRIQAVATAVLCAACFGVGAWWAAPPATSGPVAAAAPDRGPAPWRDALQAARATAEAGSLRADALEILNTADSDVALADAIQLLGWAATDDDFELLRSFARSSEAVLSQPGLEALGRLGSDAAVTELIGLLDRRDIDRGAAVMGLGHSGHPQALAALEGHLSDPELGYSAAWALARYGGPAAVDALARALREADVRLAAPIARALGSMADEVPAASEALHALLDGPRTPRRAAALAALAEAGDPLVYDLLLGDLLGGNAVAASAAAAALGSLGDPRAVPHLLKAARDGHSDVRYPAMSALTVLDLPQADDALLDLVETAPAQVAARAVHALPRVDDERMQAVLLWAAANRPNEVKQAVRTRLFSAPWGRGGVPPEVLQLARTELTGSQWGGWGTDPVALLLTHGTPADAALVEEALQTGNTQARNAAVWSLQQLQTPIADKLLLMLSDDSDPNVRQSALSALLQRGQEQMVEDKLLGLMAQGTLDYGSTEQLLVRIGSPRAVQAVLDRIENGTQREWSAAISAVANSGSKEHVDRLLAVADRTDNPQLKSQILQSLVYSETADLDAVVDRALAEGDPMLEATATYALARMGTPDSLDQLLELTHAEAMETRQSALSALAQVGGDQAEKAMIEAIEDPDLAWAAISGLQQLGTPSARDALVDVAREAEDPSVRASVLHQLPWMHGVDSGALLSDALDDDADEVRSSAISALESLGTSQAAETLGRVLDDPNAAEQDLQMAAQALQRMGGSVADRYADRIEEHVPDDPFALDTGLGGGVQHFDF